MSIAFRQLQLDRDELDHDIAQYRNFGADHVILKRIHHRRDAIYRTFAINTPLPADIPAFKSNYQYDSID